MSRYDLGGKVALVTGGARGIGLETARALHARGASVAVVDVDEQQSVQAAAGIGAKALGLAADVTDPGALETAVTAAVERFGGLDVCVANAGISPTARTARVFETDLFARVIDVNLMGVWHTVRACLPHIVEREGHLALVSSIYAFTNGTFVTPYAASKAAVEQLGRALRVELAHRGVTVGVAYFGFVDTDMVRIAVHEDPLGERFEALIPRPLQKRITAMEAGEVLAGAIAARRVRVTAPRRWAVLGALRGLLNPLIDARLARDARLREIVREADVEGRLPTRVG
jgi:NAD(P)-dependent dehydrogenase (short-subunit alcohol dehydrogenase family)